MARRSKDLDEQTPLEADRCYVTDRGYGGYEGFSLFNAIVAARSSYVCRVRNDHHFTIEETRELTEEEVLAHLQERAAATANPTA